MDAPLRLLLVADPAAAGRAVEPVRRHVPVEAAVAPSEAVLGAALRDATWDAVLFVPGGPVSDAEVGRAMAAAAAAGRAVPLVVVCEGGVPEALAGIAATALPADGLEALPFVLTSLAAETAAAAPDAFVGAANAALAESARVTAALPGALAAASKPPVLADRAAPASAPTPAATPAATPDASAMSREAESLAQHLPIGVYRSSPDGRILYANPALADVLGLDSVAALPSVDVARLGYPRDTFAEEIRRTGSVRNLTVRWTNPRGQTVYTRENARAVVDAHGTLVCYEGTMEDVTAEAEARASERLRARHHEAVVRFAEAADGAQTPAALHDAAVRALHEAMQSDWVLLVRHDSAADGGGPEGEPSAGRNVAAAWAGHVPASAAATLTADPIFAGMPVVPEPVLIRDASAAMVAWLPASIRELMEAHGMRGLGCFPLHRAGEPLGALIVGYATAHTFTPVERQAAEVLAWHLAGHLARHRAEQDLRDSEASLRFIAAHSAQVLYRLRYTPDGAAFDYLSPAVEALTGYAPAALAAAGGLAALIEEREVFAGAGLFRGPAQGATHYHAAYRLRTRGGEERWVENHAYPWHDEAGAAVGLVGALQDVTDRKVHDDQIADAQQQALARQSALVELSRIDTAEAVAVRAAELACAAVGADAASVWLVDGPWMACRALHTAPRADGGVRDAALVTPSYPADAFEAALSELRGQRSLAVDDVAADGRAQQAGFGPLVEALGLRAFVASPVRRGTETVGMVVLHRTAAAEPWTAAETEFAGALADAVALAVERDERSLAEGALRRSEARYRVLAGLTSDYAFAIWTRPDGTSAIAWATEAVARISGFAPEEIADEHGFRAIIHPESLAAVQAALADLHEGAAARFEARIVARSGETRWVQHSARTGEVAPDGSRLVYHSGQDVSERKQFEADLVTAREQAEDMARLKTAFLANMSHEIRTPLTGILGYAELLADEVSDEQRDFVAAISQSGNRLLDTLNSVLDLARLEADGVRPDLRPVDVAAEVRDAARLLAALAAKRGLTLDVDAAAPATALLDATCLSRIVINLVGNALKFTETGGVRVSVDTAAGRVRVRVADTGIGISEAFLPHLFDEFRQETDGPGRSHEGSGLGLSITKRLADLMGGRVEVKSCRPGGSTFTVSFPATSFPATSAPATSAPAVPAPATAAGAADAALPSMGDGLARSDSDLRIGSPAPAGRPLALAAAPDHPPENAPSRSFDSIPPDSPAPAAPEPAPTAMFDFRFKSPAAPATPAEPTSAEDVEWTAPPPPAAPLADDSGLAAPAWGAPVTASPAFASPFDAPEVPDASVDVLPPGGPAGGDGPPVLIVRPPLEAPPLADPSDGDPRPPVLVVEDNIDTRMLLDRILRGTYNVTAVGDARSALAAMTQKRFRGFVLDINLGGKETGTNVLRVARSIEGYADVYAVALTAYALPGDRDRLIESGFDEYISKPFTRQSLMDALAAGIRA